MYEHEIKQRPKMSINVNLYIFTHIGKYTCVRGIHCHFLLYTCLYLNPLHLFSLYSKNMKRHIHINVSDNIVNVLTVSSHT